METGIWNFRYRFGNSIRLYVIFTLVINEGRYGLNHRFGMQMVEVSKQEKFLQTFHQNRCYNYTADQSPANVEKALNFLNRPNVIT